MWYFYIKQNDGNRRYVISASPTFIGCCRTFIYICSTSKSFWNTWKFKWLVEPRCSRLCRLEVYPVESKVIDETIINSAVLILKKQIIQLIILKSQIRMELSYADKVNIIRTKYKTSKDLWLYMTERCKWVFIIEKQFFRWISDAFSKKVHTVTHPRHFGKQEESFASWEMLFQKGTWLAWT